jgi:c-di-GMP-binding flagellar brake protein YcgR
MSGTSLARRKTQLELLKEACEHGRRVRVAVGRPDDRRNVIGTRFLALEKDALLLEWPNAAQQARPPEGGEVEVFFLHKHVRYAFPARSFGKTHWHCSRRGRLEAWRLSVPLRVEQKQQREHYRVSLADIDPIDAEFTNVNDPERTFIARLNNLSAGGLGAVVDVSESTPCKQNEVYWARFTVPGESQPLRFEFVLRIMHVQPLPEQETAVLGCMFCHGEDAAVDQINLRRLEQFVMARQRAQVRRARQYGLEGE